MLQPQEQAVVISTYIYICVYICIQVELPWDKGFMQLEQYAQLYESARREACLPCYQSSTPSLLKSVKYESSARYSYKLWGIPFGTLYLLIQG